MLSDEEKEALERIDYIQDFIIENGQYNADVNDMEYFSRIKNLIEKQSKEREELKEKNKCLNWYIENQKDKIKAKIEIRKEEKENCKDSIEEKYLLREIYVLQSLLEKE